MIDPHHDTVPEAERLVTQDDLRELRGIVRNLAMALSGLLAIVERDAGVSAARERHEVLAELREAVEVTTDQLGPETDPT
jgi:hypothetical protein